jgi:hypothetical protein
MRTFDLPAKLNFQMRSFISQYKKTTAQQSKLKDAAMLVELKKLLDAAMKMEKEFGLDVVCEARAALKLDDVFKQYPLRLV